MDHRALFVVGIPRCRIIELPSLVATRHYRNIMAELDSFSRLSNGGFTVLRDSPNRLPALQPSMPIRSCNHSRVGPVYAESTTLLAVYCSDTMAARSDHDSYHTMDLRPHQHPPDSQLRISSTNTNSIEPTPGLPVNTEEPCYGMSTRDLCDRPLRQHMDADMIQA